MVEGTLLAFTVVGFTLLLLVVARYVIVITNLINHFGAGKDCDLAKIGWGVRAIDKETAIIPGGVEQLNAQLRAIRDGLIAIDRHVVAATQAQE